MTANAQPRPLRIGANFLLAIGGMVATLLILLPQTSPAEGLQTPSASEISEYRKDFPGASAQQAKETLEIQHRGTHIVGELKLVLGEDYAGVWFDHEEGEFVVPLLTAADRSTAGAKLSASGLSEDYRTSSAEFSWEELEAMQDRVDEELRPQFRQDLVLTSLDPRTNSVVVHQAKDASKAERDTIQRLTRGEDVRVDVREKDVERLRIELRACVTFSPRFCDKPLRGGVGIGQWNSSALPGSKIYNVGQCSAAFKAVGKSAGNRYLLTAGHCVAGTTSWGSRHTGGGEEPERLIGNVAGYSFPGGDWGKISANGSYWDTSPWPSQVAHYWEDQNRAINYEAYSYLGQYVCHSGTTTGTSCGNVLELGVTSEPAEGNVYNVVVFGKVCSAGGDSGGSVFAGSTALGIYHGDLDGSPPQEGACGGWLEDYGAYTEITDATDSLGVTVGTRVGSAPSATTNSAASVQPYQATLKGKINPNAVETYYHFDWGTSTSYTNQNPVPDGNAGHGSGVVEVQDTVYNLTPATTYHYRLDAHSAAGTGYGSDIEFTTPPAPPKATTEGATNIRVEEETGKATLHGKVNAGGASTDYRFEWGTVASGKFENSAPVPDGDAGKGTTYKSVQAGISGLKGSTEYHYRLRAENSEGTDTGAAKTFTTPNWKPGVSTGEEGDAGTNEATIYGSVNPRGFASTYQFEWGTWEEYLEGPLTNVIPAEPKSVGSGTTGVAVEETLKGLAPGSIYIFRLVATNSEGTTEGYYGYVVTETGLVAVYSFEEGEGTTLNDLVGEHDGTVEGGAAWVEGKYGTALDFDGTDDFVDIAHAADLSFGEDFTLQAWVRPDTLKTNKGFVLSKGQGLPLSGYWLKASHGAEVPAGITGDGGELSTVSGSSSLPASEWSHLALVSEESESEGRIHRLYVDGELAATETEAAYGSPGTGSLKIGKGIGNYFDGAIDEVRIFASALTQAQIEEGKDHRLFQAEAEPATMEGLDAGTHLISFPSSLQISCSETALDDIELNEPSETVVATPVYAGCSLVVFGGGSLTFDGDGCRYAFDGGFDGLWQVESMDIVDCDGAGMTFTTTGGCIYTIPPQADLEAGYETIGSGAEREVEVDVSSLIEVKRSGAGMCSSPTTYSASYSGTWNVAAFDQKENQVGAWIE